jgi:pyruvate/2-oxoglutarate dehydrogenase complex dihydrolipoamide dehydrogenase (E3) component
MGVRAFNPDLCIIGAGSAGLSLAAGAAQLGLSVVLFEAGEMGGDCLNYGCVPSKALIAAAKQAQNMREAHKFGVAADEPRVDWMQVKAHVQGVIAAIAPNDSQERFESLGVIVIRERARFEDPGTIVSASARVRAKRMVIATGSRAALPPIPGLDQAGALSNETIFDIDEFPRHLIVLGGGAIGIELGQAFRRLGAQVTIVEAATILGGADREAAEIVLARLNAEGVEVLEGARVQSVERCADGVSLQYGPPAPSPAAVLQSPRSVQAGTPYAGGDAGGPCSMLTGSHLLVAAGRPPNFDGLNLAAANIAFDKRALALSPTLRSIANPRVWALGDAAGGGFTHTAGWHASVFVRNVLFKAHTRADALAMPAVTYCDPELAQIGLTEAQAREQFGDSIRVARSAFHDNDRAQAQRETEGFCKLVIGKGGKLLGATILGAEAGELIAPLALAMANKLGVRALTGPVLPYPTRSEIVKRAAGAYFTPTLFSPGARKLVGLLKRIG